MNTMWSETSDDAEFLVDNKLVWFYLGSFRMKMYSSKFFQMNDVLHMASWLSHTANALKLKGAHSTHTSFPCSCPPKTWLWPLEVYIPTVAMLNVILSSFTLRMRHRTSCQFPCRDILLHNLQVPNIWLFISVLLHLWDTLAHNS